MQRHIVSALAVTAGLLLSDAATAQLAGHVVENTNAPAPSTISILGTVADLSVTNAGFPLVGTSGAPLTYTVVVANAGPGVAANVTLTNSIPANTTFASLTTAPGWNCVTPPVGDTGTVLCTRAVVPMSDSSTFTLVVTVDAGMRRTTINNVATVFSPTSDPVQGNNSVTVGITAPVSLQSFGVE